MKLATKKSILKVRAMASVGIPVSYSGDDDSSGDCLIGIEHLLTKDTILEVKTCRGRCVRVVLEEQARQAMNPSDAFGWADIAIASLVETKRATVRARKFGKFHHDSI